MDACRLVGPDEVFGGDVELPTADSGDSVCAVEEELAFAEGFALLDLFRFCPGASRRGGLAYR